MSHSRVTLKGFYRRTNTLVEIEKHTVLKVTSTMRRLAAFIQVLQLNLVQYFDFVVEQEYERGEPTAYLSLYFVRQVQDDEAGNRVSLLELMSQVKSIDDARIILSCIVQQVAVVHETCGVALGDVSPENFFIDRTDNQLYFHSFPIEVMPATGKALAYQSPEYLFNSPEHQERLETDYWAIGCLAHDLLCGRPLFSSEGLREKYESVLQVMGKPPTREEIPYCNNDQYLQIHITKIVPALK